ncbi:MAG: type II/IV secretion system ATPase subunit [DPANN group archaeon]|nr:type II/IV secretion system ATPase subunit [DPANN group archaeon]
MVSIPLRGWLRQKLSKAHSEAQPYDFSKELNSFNISTVDTPIFHDIPDDLSTLNINYPLIPPFAFASIKWNVASNSLIYSVIEPTLEQRDREIYAEIEETLSDMLDVKLGQLKSKEDLFNYLKENVRAIIVKKGIVLRKGEITRIMYYIFRNFVGLNEIEPVLHDSFIEDIGCDGVSVPIFVLHKKFGSIKTDIYFKNMSSLSSFVVKLAERCGRYISYAEPLLDGSLPDGSRIQATYSKDVTTNGPTFSIRKFSSSPFSIIDMINYGTGSIDLFAYLWYLVEHQKNFLICGTTAAGKTSLLNSLVSFIPPQEKIVSIEDTRELHLLHENWIPSVTRQSFGAGKEKYGEVTMFDLLKSSFRQNPDYVIVGEVRGVEASVLFQGMASGHASLSTMHAGSVDEIIQRLTTPPISLSAGLINALDVVIFVQHAGRFGINARRIRETDEISNVDVTNLKADSIKTFFWQPSTDDFKAQHSLLVEKLSIDYGISIKKITDEMRNRSMVLFWLYKNNIHQYDDVAIHLSNYYMDKDKILSMISEKTYHTKQGIFTNKAYKDLKDKTLFSSKSLSVNAMSSRSTSVDVSADIAPKTDTVMSEYAIDIPHVVSPDTKKD